MLHFCFNLGEVLGIVDPRVIYQQADSELMALWSAHFALKREKTGNPATPSNSPSRPATRIIDHQDIDRQVSECERLLL